MHHERPSTKRIMLTLAGWMVGLAAVGGIVLGVAWQVTSKSASSPASSDGAAPTSTVSASATVTFAPSSPAATPSRPASPTREAGQSSLAGAIVVIDAGHQLHGDNALEPIGPGSKTRKPKVTTGATGVATHQFESAVNLAVALKLRETLRASGVRVFMVRTRQDVNIPNSKRAAVANRVHADLFIRLHCDSSTDHSMNGFSTLVPRSNKWTKPIVSRSVKAGRIIERVAVATTGARNAGVVTRGDLTGFNWSKVPTVLVEMGFLSNAREDRKLATSAYQSKLADALANGIERYLTSR